MGRSLVFLPIRYALHFCSCFFGVSVSLFVTRFFDRTDTSNEKSNGTRPFNKQEKQTLNAQQSIGSCKVRTKSSEIVHWTVCLFAGPVVGGAAVARLFFLFGCLFGALSTSGADHNRSLLYCRLRQSVIRSLPGKRPRRLFFWSGMARADPPETIKTNKTFLSEFGG